MRALILVSLVLAAVPTGAVAEQASQPTSAVAGSVTTGDRHSCALAASAVELGPLGQELAEANEPQEKQNAEQAPVATSDQHGSGGRDGSITIPAVALARRRVQALP